MSTGDLAARLAELTRLDAPVGFEEPVLRYCRDQLDRLCDRVETDLRGNVYGWLEGTSAEAPRVMLTAHADEIGLMVTSILPDGFLRFAKLGHPNSQILPGQRVRVLADSQPVEGVIGVPPGHILTEEEALRLPPVEAMYIDVGAGSAEEVASWGIEVGTPATLVGELTATRNPHRFFGKAVDNRMGILCVLEIARRLRQQRPAATVGVAIVVEEEVGLRGAAVAAAHIQPQVVLAIDTVPSGGTPDVPADRLPWDIGKGPLLKVRETKGLSTHGPLRRLIRQVAADNGIPYQLVVDTAGITDATSAQQAGPDIAAAVIGLARRYSHSAVELFDLRDMEAIIDLTTHVLAALHSREQLLRV